jgi:hypothetical protein
METKLKNKNTNSKDDILHVAVFKQKKKKAHFLHIGKTGGSAIKAALANHLETPKYILELHDHGTLLIDVPWGEYVFFFLRDPVSRFVSGFYSRLRKGQPRYRIGWNAQEKEVFKTFNTPNQLACSLADKNSKQHMLSIKAMKHVQHFKPYKKWYGDFEYFKSRIGDILYIGFQESLNADFAKLIYILGLPESISLPIGYIAAHRNPSNVDKSIDAGGILALQEWFAEDFEFISICKEVMSNKNIAADKPLNAFR